MKIRSNIKAGIGIVGNNHNEKMTDNSNDSIERGKSIIKKLSLKKETIRELKESDLKRIAGGAKAITGPGGSCYHTECC